MRTRLAAGLVRAAQRFAVWLIPRPPLPPRRSWELCSPNVPHAVVAFLETDGWKRAEFHVEAVVVEGPGRAYVVDSAPCRRLVKFIPDDQAGNALELALLVADYAVRVPLLQRKRDLRESVTGAFDCVAVTKRAIGLYAPQAYTPRQLLAELWKPMEAIR